MIGSKLYSSIPDNCMAALQFMKDPTILPLESLSAIKAYLAYCVPTAQRGRPGKAVHMIGFV